MLISHSHRFIFIKTAKTGGTTVESVLRSSITGEPLEHKVDEVISSSIHSTARNGGGKIQGSALGSHSTLEQALQLYPQAKDYIVIVCYRHPFEMVVSNFWWELSRKRSKMGKHLSNKPFWVSRVVFNLWLLANFRSKVPTLSRFIRVDEDHKFDIPIKTSRIATELPRVVQELTDKPLDFSVPEYKSNHRLVSEEGKKYFYGPVRLLLRLVYRKEFRLFRLLEAQNEYVFRKC